ncbi:V-type ATP synthase subunit F [Peptoniphilus equinus]|uniref:V-type ATP synthase subunit F n=1 Tax=Peptoniphilus equinus TaxID=3016343 RepID=A0ABY7QU91_9FIRM|nr:V-type ATP synthase subunit F [Peptoniphilus equinus]WBW49845.1 V-type ATP synthase subunit F [Peptoniphilus equinus]
MYKIAVVGDKNSVLAFKALGVEVKACYTKDDARLIVDELAREKYGLIFITEDLAQEIETTINRYNNVTIPAIVPIPSNKGSLGIGMKKIDSNVEKAVGSNIL